MACLSKCNKVLLTGISGWIHTLATIQTVNLISINTPIDKLSFDKDDGWNSYQTMLYRK